MTVPIRRRSLPEVVGRAADILEATMRDIEADQGEVSQSSLGSLLAVLCILRGDHDL
jgi:hypothetical protein